MTGAPTTVFDVPPVAAPQDPFPLPVPQAPPGWPAPPDDAVFCGLAGEIVAALAPHTEADPVAILVSLLVGFGSLVGSEPHYRVGPTAHCANEFAVLVGPSGVGRKGSSWDAVEAILAGADPEWANERVVSGLSSGEGLIWHLRDRDGDAAADRRLLVLEPEYASVLKAVSRESSTLSPVVRNAWDHRVLQVITKHDPARASDAHVAIVAHITADELLRHVSATDIANGFLNRFLLVCVRRSRLLPEGGQPDPATLASLSAALADAAGCFTGWAARVRLDEGARAMWWQAYPRLSAPRPGLFGAATARAEAHVVRLALLYALLDKRGRITTTHLDAALALWDYAARSALYVFGDSLGDPIADEIRRALAEHPEGLTRSELRDLFSRNRTRAEIGRALDLLAGVGLARSRTERDKGRPVERWSPSS